MDGIVFDSKKEARYYGELLLRRRAGDIAFFLRQVPFHLPGNVRYVVDFQVHYPDGRVEWVDVKGVRTQLYKVKKRLVEAQYPVQIREV